MSYLDYSSDTHCTRGEFGTVMCWSQTLRSWRRWTHRKPTQKGSMGKRWYFPNKRIHFTNRRWTIHSFGKRSGTENIHFGTAPISLKSRSPWFSWRIRRISSTISWLVSGCRWSNEWFLVHVKKHQFSAMTLKPEWSFARREKNYSILHWSTLTCWELHKRIWMSSKKNASMIIDCRRVKRSVGSLGRFHSMWSGREIKEENKRHPGQIIHGQKSGESMGKECQAEGEAKVVAWKAPSWHRTRIVRDLFHWPWR